MKTQINRIKVGILITGGLLIFPVLVSYIFILAGTSASTSGNLIRLCDEISHLSVGTISLLCGGLLFIRPKQTKEYVESQEQTERGRESLERVHPIIFQLMGVFLFWFGLTLFSPSTFLFPLFGLKL